MPFDNLMKLTVHKLTIFLRKPKAEQFPITSSHQTENSFIHVRTNMQVLEYRQRNLQRFQTFISLDSFSSGKKTPQHEASSRCSFYHLGFNGCNCA